MLTILWMTLGIVVAMYVAMMFWNPPRRRSDKPVPDVGRYPTGSAPGGPGSEGMHVAAPGEITPGAPGEHN